MSYQAMKRHEGNLKHLVLSERCQCEKATYCIIPTIGLSGKGKFMETVNRSVAARGWMRGI